MVPTVATIYVRKSIIEPLPQESFFYLNVMLPEVWSASKRLDPEV